MMQNLITSGRCIAMTCPKLWDLAIALLVVRKAPRFHELKSSTLLIGNLWWVCGQTYVRKSALSPLWTKTVSSLLSNVHTSPGSLKTNFPFLSSVPIIIVHHDYIQRGQDRRSNVILGRLCGLLVTFHCSRDFVVSWQTEVLVHYH